jgi:hypothetical protein
MERHECNHSRLDTAPTARPSLGRYAQANAAAVLGAAASMSDALNKAVNTSAVSRAGRMAGCLGAAPAALHGCRIRRWCAPRLRRARAHLRPASGKAARR